MVAGQAYMLKARSKMPYLSSEPRNYPRTGDYLKFLKICERCRLRQQNSGYAGKFRCFLERRVLKQFVFDSHILKRALQQTRQQ